jgi:hypothetical protein
VIRASAILSILSSIRARRALFVSGISYPIDI